MRKSILVVTLALAIGCKSKEPAKNQPPPAASPTTPTTPPTPTAPTATAATPCTMFAVGDAEIYSGQTEFGKTKQVSGDATSCKYGKDGAEVITVQVIDGTAAFDGAPGDAATVATLEKAKWDAEHKILTGVAKGKTLSVKYGPGALKSDDKTAGSVLQLLASKL